MVACTFTVAFQVRQRIRSVTSSLRQCDNQGARTPSRLAMPLLSLAGHGVQYARVSIYPRGIGVSLPLPRLTSCPDAAEAGINVMRLAFGPCRLRKNNSSSASRASTRRR